LSLNKEELKRLLYSYPYIDEQIERLTKRLEWILDNRYNITTTSSLSGMPGGGSISNPVYAAVEKIFSIYDNEAIATIENINHLIRKRKMVDDALEEIDLTSRLILEMRYFRRYRWERISGKVGISSRQCIRISNEGLGVLVKNIKMPEK